MKFNTEQEVVDFLKEKQIINRGLTNFQTIVIIKIRDIVTKQVGKAEYSSISGKSLNREKVLNKINKIVKEKTLFYNDTRDVDDVFINGVISYYLQLLKF